MKSEQRKEPETPQKKLEMDKLKYKINNTKMLKIKPKKLYYFIRP